MLRSQEGSEMIPSAFAQTWRKHPEERNCGEAPSGWGSGGGAAGQERKWWAQVRLADPGMQRNGNIETTF